MPPGVEAPNRDRKWEDEHENPGISAESERNSGRVDQVPAQPLGHHRRKVQLRVPPKGKPLQNVIPVPITCEKVVIRDVNFPSERFARLTSPSSAV